MMYYESRKAQDRRIQEQEAREHVRAINDGTFKQPFHDRSAEEQAEWDKRFQEWNYGRGRSPG